MPQRTDETQDSARQGDNGPGGCEPTNRPASTLGARIAIWAMGLGLILASLLPLAPSDDWWIRALDFPRPHIAMLLVLEIALAWVLLNRGQCAKQALLAGLIASLGLQLLRLW